MIIVSPPAPPPPQYFAEQKRGEVNELRQLMRLMQSERVDVTKQRDVIKKVIAYMTLGIDVSQLFSEMIMACCTTDIVQKKMIYLYLGTYAETNPELAILAVNTLQKDSTDDDPAVRGLALRTLCSLRSPNVLEYLEPAVRRGLVDPSGYVRRTATMGVLKVYHLDSTLVMGSGIDSSTEAAVNKACEETAGIHLGSVSLLRFLFMMINDADAQVVVNIVNILNEILASQGGFPLTKAIAARLLNRIRQFNDWGQSVVLNLLSNFVPASDDELFDLFNILDDRLKHSSSAVILAVTRCFIRLSVNRPGLRTAVLSRLKSPLLTLTATACPEIAYVVLLHLHYLLKSDDSGDMRKILENDFKMFFCAFTDPAYIKLVKLDIIALIASENTETTILDELAEYVIADVDNSIVKRSIEVMGDLGVRSAVLRQPVLTQLMGFMDLDVDFIRTPVLRVVQDFLRVESQLFPSVKPVLQRHFSELIDYDSLSAAIWIIGAFGEDIENAPYMLEEYINKLGSLSKDTKENMADLDPVLLELLTASMKLFFKRAPEIQPVLGTLLKLILNDDSVSLDVRDRALFCYRFLQEAARQHDHYATFKLLENVISSSNLPAFDKFKDADAQVLSSVDFNTLALIFKSPPSAFIAVKTQIPFCGRFIPPPSATAAVHLPAKQPADQCSLLQHPTAGRTDLLDVIGVGDKTYDSSSFLIGIDTIIEPSSTPAIRLEFLEGRKISPTEFEKMWLEIRNKKTFKTKLAYPFSPYLCPDTHKQPRDAILNVVQRCFSKAFLSTIEKRRNWDFTPTTSGFNRGGS